MDVPVCESRNKRDGVMIIAIELAEPGDRVRAGETIIAQIKSREFLWLKQS